MIADVEPGARVWLLAMQGEQILITGATGTVGGQVVRVLLAEGVPFRALVRDRAKASVLSGAGVEVGELESNAIEAAAGAGVRHVVKLSTAGVTQDGSGGAAVPRQYPLHRRSEERLRGSGLAFTDLRPGPFMQNTLSFAPSIAAEGVFRGAWGDGAMGYIDVRDVAT